MVAPPSDMHMGCACQAPSRGLHMCAYASASSHVVAPAWRMQMLQIKREWCRLGSLIKLMVGP